MTDAAVDELRAALGGSHILERLLSAEEPENVRVVADYISKVGSSWHRRFLALRVGSGT